MGPLQAAKTEEKYMTMTQLLLLLMAAAIFLASLAAFAVQLIILSLTERRFRFLRWVTLAVPALALGCAGLTESIVRLAAAGALLLGWALGWGVYKFWKIKR